MKFLTQILLAMASLCASSLCMSAPSPDCCGPISPAGVALAAELDASGVDRLWLAGRHVDWETGEPDRGDTPAQTHCSAFAAAFAQRRGVYLLRPPQHGQVLLATAQVGWLASEQARQEGWRRLAHMRDAQSLANAGRLVVAAFPSPNPKKPGHIAIVRPAEKTLDQLETQGPQITQAGQKNFLSTTVKTGFRYHPGAWPNGMVYYAFE